MKIKETKVIAVDSKSGFVLKQTITDSGEFLNRKLAVPNTIYVCEKQRAKLNKPLMNLPFQTYHLKWDKSNEEWELTGLKKAKKHAEQNNRIFIPFNQRNQQQWESLSWNESLEDVTDLLRKTEVIPFSIPPTASLEEWISYKEEASKKLSEKQILIPIISSKHDVRHFPDILTYEIKLSKLLGISCFELTDSVELLNLNFVKSINSRLKVGDSCALRDTFLHFSYLNLVFVTKSSRNPS